MPAVEFVRNNLLDSRSPACWWKHPLMAAKVVLGALENALLAGFEAVTKASSRTCPVCRWRGLRFRNFLSADEIIRHCICPVCGSFDRHRQLVLGVRGELATMEYRSPEVMVGFSLSTAMRFLLEHEGLSRCFRTDFTLNSHRFAPDLLVDLRQAPLASDSVDWIFCSHVLEHIPELDVCVDEILRLLRPGGMAWLQVPLEPCLAHSRPIRIDPHRAHAHAWQFAPDFGLLIQRDGWEVKEVIARDTISPGDLGRYAIDPLERYWVCRKKG